MQPALRAASRILTFLEQHDPFWSRLMDAFNRVRIPASRDPRPPHKRKIFPAWNFRMQNDGSSSTVADDHVRSSVDAIDMTWKTLHSCIQFELGSAFGSSPGGETLAGSTAAEGEKIVVTLSADCLWPLVVDGYSHDEKIMSHFSVAATIIHEIAQLLDIGVSLFGSKGLKERNPIEPYFGNEQKSELGHSTENYIFGGSNWQAICQSTMPMRHLHFLPSGSLMIRWPTGFKYESDRMQTWSEIRENPSDMILRTPPMPADTYRLPVKVADVARFFSEGFWKSEAQRFGTAALSLGTSYPTKVRFITDEFPVASTQSDTSKLGKKIMTLWPDEDKLQQAGAIVWEFLERLLGEYFRYHSLHFRWHKDYLNLFFRLETIELGVKQFDIAVMEAQILNNLSWYTSPDRKKKDIAGHCNSWKVITLQRYRALIKKRKGSCFRVPFELPFGSERLQDDNTFWDRIEEVGRYARRRFDELLRKTYDRLSFEVDCIRELYLDIYQLSTEERERSKQRKVINQLVSRLKVLEKQCNKIHVCHHGVSALKTSFDVKPHFAQSFTPLMEQIKELIPWAQDISEINPNNFQLLQPLIPNIRKAKRPASMRLVKFAQKEIDLMPVECLVEIQPFLLFIQDKLKAAKNVRIDLVRDQKDLLEAIVDQLKASRDPNAADDDSDENDDPLTKIIKKRKNNKDNLPSSKDTFKRRRIYTPRLAPSVLDHPRPLSNTTGPKLRKPLRNTKASMISPTVADPNLQPRLPNPFAEFPSFTFPLENRNEPYVFSSQHPQPPPQVFNAFPHRMPGGPQPMGIFPHPGALSASFTYDLLMERNFREALAIQSAKSSPMSHLAFKGHSGFQDVPREPPPLIPDSPESERSNKRYIPDPQSFLPVSESVPSSPPLSRGPRTLGFGSPEEHVEYPSKTATAMVQGNQSQMQQLQQRRHSTCNASFSAVTGTKCGVEAGPQDTAALESTANGLPVTGNSAAPSRGRSKQGKRMDWEPSEVQKRARFPRPDSQKHTMKFLGSSDPDGDQAMMDF
ncbi:uncharacterized protein ColSpa_11036 [Colletotrichum spaethianum]|uniref:Uncharacterized protein n=1 Tax=Colletotrichum spaethianum TaxID=700344 RepID=A0AA37PEK0_9PEZI|nr:uncharacterized protein ColSpa_11036 [Colletotrichum spaethianum]GKT50855.1 hypothetical protein ColSpa_11036 [Colletotrichum spaethianum]